MNEQLDLFVEPTVSTVSAPDYDYGEAKRYYHFSERYKARKDFREVFDADIEYLIGESERLLQVMTKRVVIDPFKFDDILHYKHGNYEDNSMSMEDIINTYYGKRGMNLFMALTHGALSGDTL
jgi:hypothetical protein